MRRTMIAAALGLSLPAAVAAHDTWVQTNTHLVRVGDAVHVDLMLGNHGNGHRDFKLAGKVGLEGSTLSVVTPDGKEHDLKGSAADLGYAPTDGFWSSRFVASQPGLYTVAHTYDRVVTYAPKRAIKSAKAYFVASTSLDRVPRSQPRFRRPLGHPLELVPESDLVTSMAPGRPIKVRLFFRGRPLAGTRVSFVPRGETLAEGTDSRYDLTTDSQGRVSFTPSSGNYYLVTAHHKAPEERGSGYESTEYSAALTVLVPQVPAASGD